jgi:transaldolase
VTTTEDDSAMTTDLTHQSSTEPAVTRNGGGSSPLLRMSQTTPTLLWNDSATPSELSAAIGWGAVGATCNPVIALAALRSDLPRWQRRIREYAVQHPSASESDIGWAMVKELSVEAAALLTDAFTKYAGRNGRLSVQTDPRLYRDVNGLVAQAVEFDGLAPNTIVKIPATDIGIQAMEEATYRGVSINATVSFTVPQALAVAEAIERGLERREADGLDVAAMGPVCTIMVGRLDDWLKAAAKRDSTIVDPGVFEWAGVAVFKQAYRLFRERGFRTRLLSAAFRNHMHWSQLVGGEVVISPPFEWQQKLNASGIEPLPRMDEPVAPAVLDTLYERIPDFRRAYDVDGMTPDEFLDYGATRKTLRQFLSACADLEALVRDVLLPDPEK